MTPAQDRMYWSLMGRLRDVYKAKGLPFGDVQRHAFHKKALGYMKSHTAFNNHEIDKVKADILAIVEPDNLTNQLRALDQPELRRDDAWRKVYAICEELRIANGYAYDDNDLLNRRVAYIDGIVSKVIKGKKRWDQLDDREANVVLGIMQRRQMYQRRSAAKHATPDPDRVPF